MIRKFYARFLQPRLDDPDLRSRELVLNILLAMTLIAIILAGTAMLLASVAASNGYMTPRIGLMYGLGGACAWLYWQARRGHYWPAAISLVLFYGVIAFLLMYLWGTRLPVAVLLCGLNVVLAGVLLGARFIIYSASITAIMFVVLRYAEATGLHHPHDAWIYRTANMNGGVGVVLVIGLLAVISGLFNYQMERSLRRTRAAEAAIIKQNELLEQKVEERTRELQEAQIQKIQQLYRFAELGQLSTALLHDLANQLTVLTIDIEDLEQQGRSLAVKRAKRSINYIDTMVKNVREQLQGKSSSTNFSAPAQLSEVVNILAHKAQKAKTQVIWQPPHDSTSWRIKGDPVSFRQMVTNIVSNAIEASERRPDTNARSAKEVMVQLSRQDDNLHISVTNWGSPITAIDAKRIFEPFFSNKKSGMGMGLYIAKHIAEDYFGGDIHVTSTDRTEFTIRLPLKGHAR